MSEENGEDSTDNVTRFYVESDADFSRALSTICRNYSSDVYYEIVLRTNVTAPGGYHILASDLTIYSDTSGPYTGNYSITFTEKRDPWGGGYVDGFTISNVSLTFGKEDDPGSGVTITSNVALGDYACLIELEPGWKPCEYNFYYSTIDGNNLSRGITVSYSNYGIVPAINFYNSTICNTSGHGLYLNGDAVTYMDSGSSIINCGRSDIQGGGICFNNYGGTLKMEDGSKITGCTAQYGGGIYVGGLSTGKTLTFENLQVYGNTATSAGDDIFLNKYFKSYTINIPEPSIAGATDANGYAIDGWYPDDAKNGRYNATKHVDPVSGNIEMTSTGPAIGLVASHAVYDIAFAGDNAGDCSAYDKTGAKITAAAPGDKVYLKYADNGSLRSGLAEGQCIGWEGVTGDGTEEGSTKVRVIGADPDAYFTMPKEPVSNKVTLTPAVMNTADVDDGSDPEEPGSDGGSSDGGAGAVVAGTLIGGTAYLLTTRVWLEGLYGYLPANRIELALGLWKRADCPAPVSTELYPDIDEDDTDAQAAARWCVEQGLLKDYHQQNDDGTETVTFKPLRYVARPYALNRWYKLEKLLSEQQSAAK